jgi:hypothetical protein
MTNIRVATAGIALLAGGVTLSLVCPAQGQPVPVPEKIQRPLSRAAWDLEGRYATVVTYEDPILLARDDMAIGPGVNENNPRAFSAGLGLFALPARLTPAQTPRLDTAALGEVLDLYHQLNPSGPRFRVLETRYGLHIVPDTVRDRTGARVPGLSVLDTPITIPTRLRTAQEHLRALSDAVTAASGVKVGLTSQSTDGDYAYNGLVPNQGIALGTDEEKRPFSFDWGAPAAVPARQALISLLEGSSTTLTWWLWCFPALQPENRLCLLTVAPLSVDVMDEDGKVRSRRMIFYDRCTRCPPLPSEPAGKQ